MNDFQQVINIVPDLLLSIIILWLTSHYVLECKRIKPFLPFFLFGIIFCYNAAFTFFNLRDLFEPVVQVIKVAEVLAVFAVFMQIHNLVTKNKI